MIPSADHPASSDTGDTRTNRLYRTRDDRGRSVSMLDPVAMHMLHRPGSIEPATLDALVQAIGPGTSRWRRWFFWICFTLGLSALVISLVRAFGYGYGLDMVGRVLWCVNAGCLAIGLFGLWISARTGRFRRVRGAMLTHGCCPHCGYDLQGLAPDESDDCTICPECGCAWRVPELET